MKVSPQKTQFEVKISRGDSLEPGPERSVGFFLLVDLLGGGRGGSQPCAGSGVDLLPTKWLFNGWISSYFCYVPSNNQRTERSEHSITPPFPIS